MGSVNYQHILSSDSLIALAGMVRDNARDLYSNPESTPIIAFQHNYFREGYAKGTLSIHRNRHEFKVGAESDAAFLHEHFSYNITDPMYFDQDTPPSLTFADGRPDLEQAAFVEDLIRLGDWTVSAGLRCDHYQLLLNQNAFRSGEPNQLCTWTRPAAQLAVSSSLEADIYKREKLTVHLQIDGENLNNRLNVIDFGGLFSGNAIGPARRVAMRLNTSF